MNTFANYNFNFNAVPQGIISIAILITGLIIFLQNTKSATNRFFFFSCLSLFVWLSGFSIIYLTKQPAAALGWFKYYTQLGIISIAPSVYFFSRTAARTSKLSKPLVIFVYFLVFVFYGLGFNLRFVTGITRYPWGWYPLYGALAYYFLAFFILFMVLAVVELWFCQGKSDSKSENEKAKILLIATLIGYLGVLDFLPALGIKLYPFGYITVFIWFVMMGYAILKYKLMRITPAVAADQIIATIPDFLILADARGKIIQVNRAVMQILSYGQEDLVGKAINIVFSEKADAEYLMKVLLESGAVKNFETAYRSKDEKKIPVLFSASVLRNISGDIQGLVFSALDITEIKRSEEELRNIQVQLLQSSKMASLGLLAGGVAHEINNPLTGVLNNVQLIKIIAEQKREFSIADFKEILDAIESSAVRCHRIIQALLEFSHTSKGAFQRLSLDELIDKVVSLIEHELRLQNIIIQKELAPNLPFILGDYQLLQQAIFDIINNAKWAIQKKPQKEGSITVKTVYDTENGKALLYISDTGIGISKEDLNKIFVPFFTTKVIGEGTGLGLSIVYKIINSHNGNIEVDSQIGKGTTFKIELPISP